MTDSTALTRADWEARYLDEYGNLRPAPMNGGVPGTRVRFDDIGKLIDAFGSELTRLGSPHGEFFTILGGDFDQRAPLPSAAQDRLHTYRMTGVLPQGWVVELGEVAPAYGRGGGARYVLFLGPDEQKMNGFELLDAGVIEDVATIG
ncbi:glycohydrolase toxin TNT-related protein [Herbiconiux sp. SYSU D00978]|uniref:glycohydrolase toxin TNT-related protein n=1 Tax=Herbiconiux sp. SYSU D00978 TaxID=2812562 RepID=UPI001A9764FC|nr:glycohydrolase toxin TNT-related protein [Herbiconiux sp. SYSU D00978]